MSSILVYSSWVPAAKYGHHLKRNYKAKILKWLTCIIYAPTQYVIM